MHTTSGLLDELAGGTTLPTPRSRCWSTCASMCRSPARPRSAGNSVGTDRGFLARDMPALEGYLHYRDDRRLLDQGAGPPLVPAGRTSTAREERRPPRPRGHPREHRRSCATTARRSSCRSPGPTRQTGQGDRRRSVAASAKPRSRALARPARPPEPRARAPSRTRYTFSRPVRSQAMTGMVGIAQLVEHLVVVQGVAGSSPVTHPMTEGVALLGVRRPPFVCPGRRAPRSPRRRTCRRPARRPASSPPGAVDAPTSQARDDRLGVPGERALGEREEERRLDEPRARAPPGCPRRRG